MWKRAIGGLVDAAGRRPFVVLLLSVLFTVACWTYARKLELRSDFLELLPRDSPGFQAFEHQLGRVGGGATFLVVVESPHRQANERFVDDLQRSLTDQKDAYITYVEAGTKDLQKFFEDRKWLYADAKELAKADETLDEQIAIRSGLVVDLEHDDAPAAAGAGAGAGASASAPQKPTLGMDEHYARWKEQSNKHNDFPSGYFASPDGTTLVVRIVSNASGTGGMSGDRFLAEMNDRIAKMKVTETYDPAMRVGFAGDIPNAVAEKESTLSEAAWATGIAFLFILGGIVLFYRSLWSLLIISVPAIMGVGCAYAFATAYFGYVNTPGAFLGAIILGNGINYPIVLLSRYREFRARGVDRETARRDAVLNAFRAELVGASVASIAYGSLSITQFRGFSQFGMIGFVGMLLVWAAIVPVVPALIVAVEWIQEKLPPWLRDPAPSVAKDGSSGPIMRFAAKATARYPWAFVAVPVVFTAIAAWQLPSYFKDPWEYNFAKLGSRSSKSGGAGEWSNKADAVFQGKQNISGTLILADTPEQVPLLKAKILANDAADPQGRLIDEIVTAQDFLPGTEAEQKDKLALLSSIRSRLTERVLSDVSPDERKRLEEMRPPDDLAVVQIKDLPTLIRRRFEENDGKLGTLMYIKYKFGVSYSDGHTLLRMAKTTDNVALPDGTVVKTASRSTIFAEMIRSMERDGPLATLASFFAVMVVVVLATRNKVGAITVLLSLLMGVTMLIGGAAHADIKLNFFNFIALPITFGIGCEYPFNVYDRTRILGGDVKAALSRTGGAVALCSYTTAVGYGSMLFSDNQALQSFGRLAMFGEIACVAMALLFLPSLLHIVLGKKAR